MVVRGCGLKTNKFYMVVLAMDPNPNGVDVLGPQGCTSGHRVDRVGSVQWSVDFRRVSNSAITCFGCVYHMWANFPPNSTTDTERFESISPKGFFFLNSVAYLEHPGWVISN